MERETRIREETDLPFELDGAEQFFDAHAHDELEQLVWDTISTLRLVGGVVQLGAARRELGKGVYQTTEIVARWNSFVPAVESQNGSKQEPVVATPED